MAQAPSYNDIRTKKVEQQAMQEQVNQQEAMRQDLDNQANAGKNAVLQEYMNRQMQSSTPQQGLGEIDPGVYSGQAARMESNSPDAKTYSDNMVQGVLEGKVNPEAMLADPSVLEDSKLTILSLLRGTGNEESPAGLGPIR